MKKIIIVQYWTEWNVQEAVNLAKKSTGSNLCLRVPIAAQPLFMKLSGMEEKLIEFQIEGDITVQFTSDVNEQYMVFGKNGLNAEEDVIFGIIPNLDFFNWLTLSKKSKWFVFKNQKEFNVSLNNYNKSKEQQLSSIYKKLGLERWEVLEVIKDIKDYIKYGI